jgi:ABC-type transporter Mla maintaining outer membrane lipid asymmetry ATPase subunit MlaF
MTKTETIKIQNGNTVIELTGADKEAFIAQREADNVQFQLVEAEQLAKRNARESALVKLAALGLTEEELAALSV